MDEREDRGVRLERRGPAGWIVLDRHARRNALSRTCIEAIVAGIDGYGREDGIVAVVLAAEGSVFCGGADLKELGDSGGSAGIRIYSRAIEAIMGSTRPVIARVQGPAAGGGVGIVAACHLAVASPEARFLTPEVRRGLFPLMVHAIIERTVGAKRAFAMDLTGMELDAHEARDLGLVNEVSAEMDVVIDRWIAHISRISPETLSRALGALHGTRSLDVPARVVELQRILDDIALGR
jgi:enoyl-CoA hydratase/carnithine racemase